MFRSTFYTQDPFLDDRSSSCHPLFFHEKVHESLKKINAAPLLFPLIVVVPFSLVICNKVLLFCVHLTFCFVPLLCISVASQTFLLMPALPGPSAHLPGLPALFLPSSPSSLFLSDAQKHSFHHKKESCLKTYLAHRPRRHFSRPPVLLLLLLSFCSGGQ